MTKEKIIETIKINGMYLADWFGIKDYQINEKQMGKIADEFLALIEQEKKEAIKDILTRLNIVIEVETRPYIEAGTVNYDKPIREWCVERIRLDNKIDEIAKEYGVEL